MAGQFDFKTPTFTNPFAPGGGRKRQITEGEKKWIWANNPHICNICGKRVKDFLDAEFDHKRAFSKGGASNLSNVVIVHRLCNRLKSDKSLSKIQKRIGVQKTTKESKSEEPKKKRRRSSGGGFLTGYKSPRLPRIPGF